MNVTRYRLPILPTASNLRLAVAADLHNKPFDKVLEKIKEESPDLILIPGDLMDDEDLLHGDCNGYRFLRACSEVAPTYYSLGNHELRCYHKGNPWRHPIPVPLSEETRERIRSTGAVLLENESISHQGLRICGLSSGINGRKNLPDADTLKKFDGEDGFRILLCHHPEYFHPYVKRTGIELTVSGHAHGGQWRILGQGIYAPGQGLFPKYTSGVLESRLVISRGLGNHTWIPRIFNSTELVVIELSEKNE